MRAKQTLAALCLLCVLFAETVHGQTRQAGSWASAGTPTTMQSQSAAATLSDGTALIIGGVSGSTRLKTVEQYDGKKFSAIASMSTARSNHAAVTLADGRVLVSGGFTTSGAETNSTELYNPTTKKWSSGPAMAQARANHTMTVMNDGRVLIAGGTGTSGPLSSLEIFDPSSNTCTLLTSQMTSPRTSHAAALLVSGGVVFAGGFNGSVVLNSMDVFDPKSNTVYGPRQMASPRQQFTATTLIDGRVLLAGGNDGTSDLSTLEVIDVMGNTVAVVGNLSTARSNHVAVALPNNNDVLIAGGVSQGVPLSSAELFSPANMSVTSAGNMSTSRTGAVAAGVKGTSSVLIEGGESSGNISTGDIYSYATLNTDKQDYAPNTTVKLTGSGWAPGETVTILLHEQPTGDPDVTLTSVADNTGSFQNSSFKPDIHDQHINFLVTAQGQVSGIVAQTVFTDAAYNTSMNSPGPLSGSAGSTIAATANLQGLFPYYQIQYYTYICGSYSCNCGWFYCDTCYDYCTGWYYYIAGYNSYNLGGQTVQFSFDTGSPVSAVTDFNGNASAPITVPMNATSLTASYAGSTDGTYGPSTAVSNFTVTNLPLLTVAAINAVGTYGQPLPPLIYTMTGFLGGDTQGSSTTGAPSEGTAASSTSTPGAYPIVITPGTLASNTYGFTYVNGALTLQQAPSTTTVISVANSIYLNQSTTVTATVSVTGSGAAPTGSVTFMAGATPLGTGTLSPLDATDSTTTFTLTGSQLITGANIITAVYSGDPNYAGSTSSAITVALLAPQVTFGSVNVGSPSQIQTLTYTFGNATTLSSVNILTGGVTGLDYADGGSTTCTASTTYPAGQTCAVTVVLTPSASGLRSGAVTMFAQGSNLPLITWYLNGAGQSGAVTVDPGTQSTIATLANNGLAYGSAIDGGGNIYVVDQANSQITKLAAGSFAQSTAVSSGLLNPTAVAVDGAGNLLISDTGNNRVVMVPNEQGTLNAADMSVMNISGLGSPSGVAVDGNGNLYVADAANGNVVEISAGTQSTIASGLTNPQGVAVDGAGNVYVSSSNQVMEYPFGGGTPVAMGSGYNSPSGLAVDASGSVYVADLGNAQVVRVAPGGASQSNLPITGVATPQGLALDPANNLYITSGGNVYQVNRSQPTALNFANTNIGSTSAAQSLTVSNAGNGPLALSSIAVTTNFAQEPSGGTDCSSSTQLTSGAQCLVGLASTPTVSGPLAGSVTLTDNSLNNPTSTQTAQLTGIGSQVSQTITFATIPTQTFGVSPFAINATASSGLPVTFAVTSGPASVSGITLTISGAGSVTVQATQVGNTQYSAATPVSQTFLVNPAATTVTWSTPAPISYGTPLSPTQLNATANVPGTFVYTPAAGMVLNAGGQTLSVAFSPTDSVDYSPSNGSVTLQVNPASQTITFPTIPTQTYGIGTVSMNATASSGLPVSYSVMSGPASVSGHVLTITGAGSVTVQASQGGNTNYTAATSVSQTFTVNPASQTITFTQNAPTNEPYNGSFTVAANSSSGLAVTFTSSGVCTQSGTTFTMTNSTGTCTVTANQAGNANYLPAQPVSESTIAAKAAQTVTFTGAPPTAIYQSTFTVASSSNSGITPTITVSGPCTISGTTVTITSGTGTCTTTAKWASNTYYLSTSVSQTTTAQKAASVVTWPTPAPITYGTALSSTQLNATANVAGSFVYSPAAGNHPKAGSTALKVTFTPSSTKNYATVTQTVTLVVNPTSTSTGITSELPNPSTAGQKVTIHFTVTPATNYSQPTGSVTVNASTGESCKATLSVGSAYCSITFSSQGTRSVTATYSGDSNNTSSVSNTVSQAVN